MATYPSFPVNPEVGDTFSYPGWERYVYVWDGSTWGVSGLLSACIREIDGSSVTTFSDSTPKLLTVNDTAGGYIEGFSRNNAGRLTLTYAERPVIVDVQTYGEISCGANNQEYHFYIVKNGVLTALYPESHVLTGNANTERHFQVRCHMLLNAGDYLETWVSSETGVAAITTTFFSMQVSLV